jgi:tRNA(Arg) A34 adenosine deaminase TadA
MISYENTDTYDAAVQAFHYSPNGRVNRVEPTISPIEKEAMEMAHILAIEALEDGNPPIGAILIVQNGLHIFGAKTQDKTSGKINGHAEIIAYEDAHEAGHLTDDLSEATLVSTAALCSSCTPLYAEGKIGRVITAAPRRLVFPLTGIMRSRNINMHEMLADGNTDTISVINYDLKRSLGLFALYGREKRHVVPDDVNKSLLPLIEEAIAA